jgi:hypothetical protein
MPSVLPLVLLTRSNECFIVYTDASNVRIGGVLFQIQDGHERAMAYYSKTLNKAERKYFVTRREILAVIRTHLQTKVPHAHRPLCMNLAHEF